MDGVDGEVTSPCFPERNRSEVGLGATCGAREVGSVQRDTATTRKRCGVLGRQHLVCVDEAGSRRKKVSSDGLGWAGLLREKERKEGGGGLGRERKRGGGPN
jgi:hypothetical protein